MTTIIFKKPGFKDRQSEKIREVNKRQSFLINCNINNDPKIMKLHSLKDHSLFGILLEIWANLDTKNEEWKISKDIFFHWARKTFSDSNRFDVLKRLQQLSNIGLIEFQLIPNEDPIASQHDPNEGLTRSQCDPNTPLETPQTHVALHANNQPTKPTKETKKTEPAQLPLDDVFFPSDKSQKESEIEAEFDKVFWPRYPNKSARPKAKKAFLKARTKVPLDKIMNGLDLYIRTVKEKEPWRNWKGPEAWLNAEMWGDEPSLEVKPKSPHEPLHGRDIVPSEQRQGGLLQL